MAVHEEAVEEFSQILDVHEFRDKRCACGWEAEPVNMADFEPEVRRHEARWTLYVIHLGEVALDG